MSRTSQRHRATAESNVSIRLDLDSSTPPVVSTGLPFFDHMLCQLGKHSGVTLEVTATGDLQVDPHHTVEDVGIVLGETLAEALGEKAGVRRFASVSLPLDETLVNVALDLSGRSYLRYDVEMGPDSAGLGSPPFEPQLAEEFWRAFVNGAKLTLHITLAYGRNPHHILEASFKGVARALREAMRIEGDGVPSTKGML
ncbi:MAG: imidazoleglycerol-phosphate dehydratase HisB [Acidimicrobiales bacterium]|jgi:imidazoleglycerol-phosphate dehydratase